MRYLKMVDVFISQWIVISRTTFYIKFLDHLCCSTHSGIITCDVRDDMLEINQEHFDKSRG